MKMGCGKPKEANSIVGQVLTKVRVGALEPILSDAERYFERFYHIRMITKKEATQLRLFSF